MFTAETQGTQRQRKPSPRPVASLRWPARPKIPTASLRRMGHLVADDFELAAVLANRLGRTEVPDGPAVGFPMVAVEAEDGRARLGMFGWGPATT